ncbi:hypothetical protein F6R98_10525 [Candidatus Methylospira mobilis]|uniref:Macro domain-containing protein n=1 Tax=Candidatus Methylospira mobilis TaxID=1808979 RepID=A0A5Q0BMN4_9GAMM|nr:hypothetical protein [Candidatus Methylospira mobilis]QFY42996.1 hypothetical protein F6R98_10525 [Candidatus Methylospira mobilis]
MALTIANSKPKQRQRLREPDAQPFSREGLRKSAQPLTFTLLGIMMRIVPFILGLALDIALKRLTRPHTVYSKLAITALLISGGAFITPFWQQAVEGLIAPLDNPGCTGPLPSIASGSIFLLLSFLFGSISQRHSTQQRESLVDTKSLSGPISIGQAQVYCYCGSVLAMSNIDVVITSENRDLHLGSINGTSVSGRIRRLAASYNSDGTLSADHLLNHTIQWKSNQHHKGPYRLGQCIVSPPFNAKRRGIKSIVHAITLEKRDSGLNIVEESANREVIDFVIKHCNVQQYSSFFLPIFGLGSGGLSRDDAISRTLTPLIAKLRTTAAPLSVYVGTYRLSDAAIASTFLLRAQ